MEYQQRAVILKGGKLEIDETKLRAAIAEDPNGIYNLFMADVKKTVDGKEVTDLEKSGIARRLRADLRRSHERHQYESW